MYPKWLVLVLTLFSFTFLMASAAPVSSGDVPPVKRLKQFQMRRPSRDDGIVARDGVVADFTKRGVPPPPRPSP